MKNNVQSMLKFNLDNQEGRDAHFRACKADMAYRALHEIEELLRSYDKYGMAQKDAPDRENVIEKIRTEITDLIISNGIDLSEEYQ